MKRWSMLGSILLTVALTTGCGDGSSRDSAGAAIPSNLTVDEVYRRMEDALDGGSGKVLHASVVTEDLRSTVPMPDGFDLKSRPDQVWIDAEHGAARVETPAYFASGSSNRVSRAIVRDDGTFRVNEDGLSRDVDSLKCRSSGSVLLAELMRCGNFLEESTTTVEPGKYRGDAAIVLVTSGTLPSHDWTSPFTARLYVDPSTYLPIAMDFETEMAYGQSTGSIRIRQRYDVEFIDRASLAADFFEPAGIGYVQDDPEANLRADVDGMRVYWLGRKLAVASAPPLSLLRAFVMTQQLPSGYRVTATYEQTGGRRNYPVVDLQEFPIEAWNALRPDTGGHFWNGAGVTHEDVPVPGGRAVLFRVPASYERYVAHVYFDTTVILISDFDDPSPYSNREAMIGIIGALRPYE